MLLNKLQNKIALLLSLAFLIYPLNASNQVFEASNSTLTIIPESTQVENRDKLLVGLNFRLEPGWHTYWMNPGDAGEGADIIWKLPTGIQSSDILWPGPETIPVDPLMTYGYEDEITLLTELSFPTKLEFPINIEAEVAWYTCKEICVPQKGIVSFNLIKGKKIESKTSKKLHNIRRLIPTGIPYSHRVNKIGDKFILELELENQEKINYIKFFPEEYGLIDYSSDQLLEQNNKSLSLTLTPSFIKQNINNFKGVIKVNNYDKTNYYEIDLPLKPTEKNPTSISIATALFFAFLGGIILNVMPCVFPILSIKILSFINHSHGSRTKLINHGLMFSSGVLITFLSIGLLLMLLKSGGEYIGWGFQLQSPLIVTLLMYLFVGIGVVFMSNIVLGSKLASLGNFSSERTDLSSSFLTGVLAVIVASPCTAPFMGSALGLALLQPGYHSIFIFISLGLGFSLPYIVLTMNPELLKKLPKPGKWMETLKQFMAFPMWASAIWLAWILSSQVGDNELMLAIFGSLMVATSIWMLEKSKIFALIIIILSLVLIPTEYDSNTENIEDSTYTIKKLERLRTENIPVFVNFTADWCITCKVNETVALNQSEVKKLMTQKGIVYLKADWTRKDEKIAQDLYAYGRTGVPLYLLFPSGEKPIILPELLTEDILLSYLREIN